jgi:hypothetical protein
MPVARLPSQPVESPPVYDTTATPVASEGPVTPTVAPSGPLITPEMREMMKRQMEMMEYQQLQDMMASRRPRQATATPTTSTTASNLSRIRQTLTEVQELQEGLAEMGIGRDNPVETILNSQFMGTFGQGLGQVVSQLATAWRERSNYEHQLKVNEAQQVRASERWREDVRIWREAMAMGGGGGMGPPMPSLPGPPSPSAPGGQGEMGGFQVPWNPTGAPPTPGYMGQQGPAAPPYMSQQPTPGPYDPMAPQGGAPPMQGGGPPGGFPQRQGGRWRMEPDPGFPASPGQYPQPGYPQSPQPNPYAAAQLVEQNAAKERENQELRDRLAIYEGGNRPSGRPPLPAPAADEPAVLEEGNSEEPGGIDPSLMGPMDPEDVQANPKKKPRGAQGG